MPSSGYGPVLTAADAATAPQVSPANTLITISTTDLDRLLEARLEERLDTRIQQLHQDHALHGPPGMQGDPDHLVSNDTQWKANDIGYFDPGLPDRDDLIFDGPTTWYTNVYVFVHRVKNPSSLKSPEFAPANIHSFLRGDALRWYAYELGAREKDMMQTCTLEMGWYASLQDRFKPNLEDALAEPEKDTDGYSDIRAGRSALEYAQNLLRLLQSTGNDNLTDQIPKIRDSIDPH
ncbi:uncharacterized protein N7482_010717 [Penicillium canariense]|uniref:Uncharacterized protein n=1 Tax=Penicillium canariense TaxID=189055 RepID=A0A9W9HMQ4_9EURO|nr:uncharacterized protein N7482_010717 [Penicillium canariense]KAJ5151465.1 hypothetical protein N7482_010717 [Penicillium canariense]